ncbi:MAG: hypothetical protein ACJASY_003562 [Halioglobus sp.]
MLRITLILVAMLVTTLPSYAAPTSATQDERVFPLGDSGAFDPTPLTSVLKEGIDSEGAIYRYEVPLEWNGDLVMYAHGFRGCLTDDGGLEPLTVDNPPLREYYLARGYAWAASSYSKNCYDVKSGVESTNRLARIFTRDVEAPNRTLITGFSMGGHVTGAAIEMYPNQRCQAGLPGNTCRRLAAILGKLSGGVLYDGAAPMCGVMGDTELFEYFGDFLFGAEAIAAEINPQVQSQFPPADDYLTTTLPLVTEALFDVFPSQLTPQGEKLKDLNRQISGGDRPIFDVAFPFFQTLLFGFAGNDGTSDGVLSGNGYYNDERVYQLDGDPAVNADEQLLNDAILRISRDFSVNRSKPLVLQRVPKIRGRISVPVVSTHTLGDLFVPFSMQQIYAREVASRNRSNFLVSRATRAVSHCEFSREELIRTFDDLVLWVNDGVKPAGDDILDPVAVADPFFGCQFTEGLTGQTPEALRGDVCSQAP